MFYDNILCFLSQHAMSPSDVFVYSGLGSNENGCFHLLNSLKTHLDPDIYKVDLISAEDIIEGSKLTSAALLTFGSGYTTGFVNGLGAKGMQNLRLCSRWWLLSWTWGWRIFWL
nr:biotin--protein ligase-like [Biomphalaria glabrata]